MQSAGGRLPADALALSLGVLACEACFGLLARPLIPDFGPAGVSTWIVLLAVPMLVAIGLAADGSHMLAAPTGREALALAYMAAVVTAGGFVAWYGAIARLGVERAGLFSGVLPGDRAVHGRAARARRRHPRAGRGHRRRRRRHHRRAAGRPQAEPGARPRVASAAMTAKEMLAAYGAGTLSPAEVVADLAPRVEEDPCGAFWALCLDRAAEEAEASAARWRDGTARPLEGVPLAVKDLFDTEGVETTYGSAMFRGHVPDRDAEAVRRCREAGAILLGKTATHEFAWGYSSINDAMGTVRNPRDPERVAGRLERRLGGGAGRRGLAPLALGTDTGGSIRVPASFCGVHGLKPTFGRVSLEGVWPLARTLDHAGPMATLGRGPRAALRGARRAARGPRAAPDRDLPRPALRPVRAAHRGGARGRDRGRRRGRAPGGGADPRRVPHDPVRRGPRHPQRAPACTRRARTSTAPTSAAGSRRARR